jgi:membrane associated rhomboid family serine protease
VIINNLPTDSTIQARLLLGFIGILWIVWLTDEICSGALKKNGIRPQTNDGLWGILAAPLLHADFRHISVNTVPLAILGWLIMMRSTQDFLIVTAVAWAASGIGVWIFGEMKSNHIGVSGVIFGYIGFLLMRGYFERSFGAIATAIVVGLLYGQSIWGIFPLSRGVSWQGHLFGFIGGTLAARYLPLLQQWLSQMRL